MPMDDVGAGAQESWEQRFHLWREAFPEAAADSNRSQVGHLRNDWREVLTRFQAGERIATHSAGQEVMAAFAELGFA
jgi:transketolase